MLALRLAFVWLATGMTVRAGKAPLIVTASNWGYRSMMVNFLCRMRMMEMIPKYNLTLLAFDNTTLATIKAEYKQFGVNGILCPLPNSTVEMSTAKSVQSASHFGAANWNSVTARKLSGVLELLKEGRDILFIDVDIALARPNLVEHVMKDYVNGVAGRGPDFVFQLNVRDPPPCARENDEKIRSKTRKHEPSFQNINSGFYFLRASSMGIALLSRAITICATTGKDDQEGFLTALKDMSRAKLMRYAQSCEAFRDVPTSSLLVCTWHECEMPTGWATGRYPARPEDPAVKHGFDWMQNATTGPYLYHPNYIAGMGNKIRKLKIKGLWVAEEPRCNPKSDEF